MSAEAVESRSFTSWVKEQLISKSKGVVLEWGVGQGGDNMKYMHANDVTKVVGVDPNPSGLYSANGAVSRYKNMRKMFDNPIDMVFIQANPSEPFKDQLTLGSVDNQKLIKDYLVNTKMQYDTVCSFFSFHYNFESERAIKSALGTLETLVKKGGEVIIVTFDGELVYNNLKKNGGTLKLEYPTEDGTKTLFEIRQRYTDESFGKINTGAAIDIYNAIFMNEGEYQTEYLVPPKKLISMMSKKKFSLVDTQLIEDLYELELFEEKLRHEPKQSLKERLTNIINYGKKNDHVIDACHVYNSMFRYYIFKKL